MNDAIREVTRGKSGEVGGEVNLREMSGEVRERSWVVSSNGVLQEDFADVQPRLVEAPNTIGFELTGPEKH